MLDASTLERLRAEAAAHAGPFLDPALFRDAQRVLASVDGDWLTRVTGRPVTFWTQLDGPELYLAVRAAAADAGHLAGLKAAQWAAGERRRREDAAAGEAAQRAAADAWAALQGRLPVPVAVCHNWTARHYDGYVQGADHIVVLADLHAGRLHRAARQVLCETPSRARQLRHVSGNIGDDRRLPDCKACLVLARRLAGE
jgi:branched-subunit amino acid aminotransferase/4-amino-4-deoxychorismate lyase